MNIYPAMKAVMGNWTYYMVMMTMRELAREIGFAHEFRTDPALDALIQRELSESRVKNQIEAYLAHEDRFFSSIVVAALEGQPTFKPISVADFDDSFYLASGSDLFGVLKFEGGQSYYAIDGQHRLEAIKRHIEELQNNDEELHKFENEQISVLMICGETDDPDFIKGYRRIFSNLNRYAKPTNRDTNIALDEDDIIAIITRQLIHENEYFLAKGTDSRVQAQGKNILPKRKYKDSDGKNKSRNNPCFTTLQTLYCMNEVLLSSKERIRKIWGNSSKLSNYKQIRRTNKEIDYFYKEIDIYWNALFQAVPVLQKDPSNMRDHNKKDDGESNALFMPITQEVFAVIARILLDNHFESTNKKLTLDEAKKALSPLNDLNWNLNSPPWRYLFLIQDAKNKPWKMRSGDRAPCCAIAEKIIMWLLNLQQFDENELKTEWRNKLVPSQEEKDVDRMWSEVKKLKN